jgi:parvulin-like peptidyl-prolyl isomerase
LQLKTDEAQGLKKVCKTVRRQLAARWVVLLTLATLAGCENPVPPQAQAEITPSFKPGVVARFGGLEITAKDVDTFMLSLPVKERKQPGENLEQWYREKIRDMVVEQKLQAQALESSLAQKKEYLEKRHQAERQIGIELCLKSGTADKAITEDELKAAYEEHKDDFHLPEQRLVYHIFRRTGPGVSVEVAHTMLEGLRNKVLNGENFLRLATEFSDSESRHKQGSLDWIRAGQLPEPIDGVIFGLDEGVPSEPVATPQGLHIFYVDTILPERELAYDEARTKLAQDLESKRLAAKLIELSSHSEETYGLPHREAFTDIVAEGDDSAIILNAPDFQLTLGDLRRRMRQVMSREGAEGKAITMLPVDTSWRFAEGVLKRTQAYQYCQQNDLIPKEQLTRSLKQWEEKVLLAMLRSRKLLEIAKSDEQRLENFYNGNIGQFSTPTRWRLKKLSFPLEANANQIMLRLESAAMAQNVSIEELQRELGGTLEALEPLTLDGLNGLSRKLAPLVAPLSAGRLSSPYRNRKVLEIVQLLNREEPEPIPFQEIKDRVASIYMRQYTHELYQELVDQQLAQGRLEVADNMLESIKAVSLSRSELSVEDLERELESL